MKKRKLALIFSFISVCILLLSITLFSQQENDMYADESRYNMNPDVSGKVVGSRNGLMTRITPVILDDVLAEATCVVIGNVIDGGLAISTNIGMGSGYEGTIYHTITKVQVLETIVGKPPESKIINYRQLGIPDDDMWQTKVEKEKTYVFILKYFKELDQYMATAFEESLFMVDKNNKLTSVSDRLFCAKYDGIDLGVFTEDAIISKERVAILEHSN
ncbi:MAG: hypothetical protein FWG31_06700 [Oscillospiraceae bacterium]|nr:hypothetical protein [Oscillospiraceae bacterium]